MKAYVNPSGTLFIRSDSAGTSLSSGVNLGAGWHTVELCGTVGTTPPGPCTGTERRRGALDASTGTTPIGRIQIGDNAAKTWTVNFDDVVLDQAPG